MPYNWPIRARTKYQVNPLLMIFNLTVFCIYLDFLLFLVKVAKLKKITKFTKLLVLMAITTDPNYVFNTISLKFTLIYI